MASKPYGRFRAGLTDQPDPSSSIITFIIPIAGNPNTLGLTTDQLTAMALDTTTGNQWYTINGSTWTQISGGSGGTLFTGTPQPLTATQWTFNHGLGGVPSMVRAVLLAQTLDSGLGYPAGKEVGVEMWFDQSSSVPVFSVASDATSIVVSAFVEPFGNESLLTAPQYSTGGSFHMGNAAFWAMKVYARL